MTEAPDNLSDSICVAITVLASPKEYVASETSPDSDMDGVADAIDNCPAFPNHDQFDADHDGVGDACDGKHPPAELAARQAAKPLAVRDSDYDGIIDPSDNCPANANHNQADLDGDTLGDQCDQDIDDDGVTNQHDNCPFTANSRQTACVTGQEASRPTVPVSQQQRIASASLLTGAAPALAIALLLALATIAITLRQARRL